MLRTTSFEAKPLLVIVSPLLFCDFHTYSPTLEMSGSYFSSLRTSGCCNWPVYGGQPENQHYSLLKQINRRNVEKLRVAWTYDTGEVGGIETSPLIVGGTLYAYTPFQQVIALDAATGRQIWEFDSGVKAQQPARGVAYWTDGKHSRIFAGIMNYLHALDAKTSKPISSFGEDGRIDLRRNLRGDYHLQSIALTSCSA